MKKYKFIIGLLLALSFGLKSNAQEKTANMRISFEKVDSANTLCKVLVSADNKPVAEVAVKLYVQRLFGLLPIKDEVTTDESGIASFEFPNNIPLNENGLLNVIAKVEDDENYGSFEANTETNIGIKPDLSFLSNRERSISAGRDRAPIYFIIASIALISGIWGTLIYVVLRVFKLKKLKAN